MCKSPYKYSLNKNSSVALTVLGSPFISWSYKSYQMAFKGHRTLHTAFKKFSSQKETQMFPVQCDVEF